MRCRGGVKAGKDVIWWSGDFGVFDLFASNVGHVEHVRLV